MASYIYSDNVNPLDRTSAINFDRADGSRARFEKGKSLDLTPSEVAQLQKYIVLTPGSVVDPVQVLPPPTGFIFPPAPWSTAQAWAARRIATWYGSSYVAVSDVPVGGAPPPLDIARWALLTQGVGLIQRAKQTSPQNLPASSQGTWTDLTGLQIVVPQGVPAFLLEAFVPALAINGAPTNVAGDTFNVGLHVRDETGAMVAQCHYQVEMAATSKIEMMPYSARAPMDVPTADHTYKASVYWTASRANVGTITIYNGPGAATGAPTTDSGPSWLAATISQ